MTPMTARDTPFGLAVIYDISQLNVFVAASTEVATVAAMSTAGKKANILVETEVNGRPTSPTTYFLLYASQLTLTLPRKQQLWKL